MAPIFLADFNVRFAKMPRSDFNAHRPVRLDENLECIFTWREWRKVSNRLTLQYDRNLYLITDQPERRPLIHRYIEVAEYPDGRIELWADGAALPYIVYDRLSEINQGAVVEKQATGARAGDGPARAGPARQSSHPSLSPAFSASSSRMRIWSRIVAPAYLLFLIASSPHRPLASLKAALSSFESPTVLPAVRRWLKSFRIASNSSSLIGLTR